MEKNNKRIETIDKNLLAKGVASRMGLTVMDTVTIIDSIQAEVIDAIKNNKKVQLNGFLTFTPKNVEGKTIISALDKKEYYIAPKRVVDVRVGKYFKESIKDFYKGKDEETDDNSKKQKRSRK